MESKKSENNAEGDYQPKGMVGRMTMPPGPVGEGTVSSTLFAPAKPEALPPLTEQSSANEVEVANKGEMSPLIMFKAASDAGFGSFGKGSLKGRLTCIATKPVSTLPSNTIYFYELPTTAKQASHFFLNIHFPCTFRGEDGREYHSCTDYYNTNKFLFLGDEKAAEEVHKVESPGAAWELAHRLQQPHKKTPKWTEWEEQKVEVMRTGIKLKFEQNSGLMESLIMTGDKTLVDEHPTDAFWY